MKIAIVHSYYASRQPSGENLVVDAQARLLESAGHEVEVLAARTDELESEPWYRIRSAINVATGFGPSPAARLTEFAPDVVHVHNLFPNWGTNWLNEWRGPVVATVHNFRPVCAAGTLFRDGQMCTLCPESGSVNAIRNACYRGSRIASVPLALQSWRGATGDAVLRRADRVVVLSERARDLYEGFGVSASRMSIVPNFVESAGFVPDQPAGQEWVYIGRLSKEKGVLSMIRHWPDDEVLTIYGDGPLRADVERLSDERGSINYCGPLLRHDVPGVLARARGLVFPSECAEGLPTVYIEALAAGRPVLARSGNSAADDVARAQTGIVFERAQDIKVALREIAEHPIDSADVRARYETAFTSWVWLDAMLEIYRGAVREGAGE